MFLRYSNKSVRFCTNFTTQYNNGDKISYQYDNENRLKLKSLNNVEKYQYTYDNDSNLVLLFDVGNNTSYRYKQDTKDHLISSNDSLGNIVNFGYNTNNQLFTHQFTNPLKE